MNLTTIKVRDAEGDHVFNRSELPLSIGSGSDADICIPGPGQAVVATLDALDDQPFIQPTGAGGDLSYNGSESLTASCRLHSGDELGYFGSRIIVGEIVDGQLTLDVRPEDSAYVTVPPQHEQVTLAEDESVVASTFKRRTEAVKAAPEKKAFPWQMAVGIAVVLLATVSYLLFSARSIQFDVQPAGADNISISGGWFRLPFAGRQLLRQGDYVVNVTQQGYYDASVNLTVDERPSQTVVIEMRRKPGRLQVLTEPATEAIVTVDDTEVGSAPFGPLQLEPGIHSVKVSAEGYLPFSQRLSVPGLDIEQQLVVQLVPRWAEVTISSNPAGATILSGTESLGETPMTVQLVEGEHEISLLKEGFAAWDTTLETEANVALVLPEVDLQPANARLLVNSVPRGANVTVNGRYRGQSPLTVALSPGVDYQIGLSKAGYGSALRRLRLSAAASEEINVDLSARVGEVTVAVLPDDAVVYINGRARGSGTTSLQLAATPQSLEVRRDGYATFARTVTPRPGYPQTINVRLLTDAEVQQQNTASTVTTSKGQTLVRVEPGEITLGTSRREQGRRANEVIVPVVVSKPFYISANVVTNAEYRRFRSGHNSGGEIHPTLAADSNPVVNVSWQDAVEYLNWLSIEEGLAPAYEKVFERWQAIRPTPDGYRLPTEAEWALALRYQGGSTAATYPWGNRMPPRNESGNFAGREAIELVPTVIPGWDDGYTSTSPVGTFSANALGIYDGGGNVSEWIQDFYAVPTPGRTEPLKDPLGPERGANYVVRGSSWRHAGILELRWGYRNFGNQGRPDIGFRIVRNAK